jgi:hypothetical protein
MVTWAENSVSAQLLLLLAKLPPSNPEQTDLLSVTETALTLQPVLISFWLPPVLQSRSWCLHKCGHQAMASVCRDSCLRALALPATAAHHRSCLCFLRHPWPQNQVSPKPLITQELAYASDRHCSKLALVSPCVPCLGQRLSGWDPDPQGMP